VRKFWFITISIFLLSSLLFPPGPGRAQTSNASGPVYIVQEGDYFQDIAYRFHVSQQDLANANGITDTNLITVGKKLIIPGLEGIQGELTTTDVTFGETLQSLSIRYHIPVKTLERLNHLTSPEELFSGYSLVILKENESHPVGKKAVINAGQSLLELAILNQTDTWSVLAENQLSNTAEVIPGDVIRLPGQSEASAGGLPPDITAVSVSHLTQGETAEVQVTGQEGLSLTGSLMDHSLNFFPEPVKEYTALQGVHAMAEPGMYPMVITGSLKDGSSFTFSQNVVVFAGDFLYDIPLSVDPATLDPAITGPEDAQWMSLASTASPDQMWQGSFSIPVEPVFAECYASRFGSRRSYNGSAYKYFHTGLDYCGQIGDPIYAAAAGVVVFTGPLTVRGNATMIDHGHGVFSAYLHQSEILVKLGDRVEQGQLIGRVGNTGRVEGPHLHFEVLVGGVQVNPLEWLKQVFP
jgi:murein DD-endopeptidase MepM/ murein hydrolase activator NlpD